MWKVQVVVIHAEGNNAPAVGGVGRNEGKGKEGVALWGLRLRKVLAVHQLPENRP